MKDPEILRDAYQVIDDEVQALNDLKQYLKEDFIEVVNKILHCKGRVILTGIGKSGHICKKISATLSSTGTSSFFMHATEAFHGDLGMIRNDDLVIAVSYSGETDDLIKTIPIIKNIGAEVIGVSGNANSSLAKLSDLHQLIKVEKEACPLDLAPTSSATATLVWGDALAVALMKKRDFQPEDFARSHPGGTLGKRLILTAKDVMIEGDDLPKNIATDLSKDVIKEISQKGLGVTLVEDKSSKLLGLITDGDVRRAIESSDDFFSLQAQDFMTTSFNSVSPDQLASDCLEVMAEKKIGCLIVMEADQILGIVNQKDLIKLGL
ncbi:KpsF/GutQ family sugar-phosphate isomerase [Pseudomonadota bacterium]|nr:KpsF/GutQ family sugar-phosphate isomerase [Pseudomonadota bacterium]